MYLCASMSCCIGCRVISACCSTVTSSSFLHFFFSALFLVLLNLHCVFYRLKDESTKVQFFKNDFSEDRWRKAALKNAFHLLARQRFQHAAAFFLLAGAVTDALQVFRHNLWDILVNGFLQSQMVRVGITEKNSIVCMCISFRIVVIYIYICEWLLK